MPTYGIPPDFRGGVHLFINCHTPSGQSRVYRVTQLRTDGVHCRESAGTGPVNLKVVSSERMLPWQVTKDQLICASLSHTHYWYEVGILKVVVVVVVVVDSHIQRIVLATEETTVTKQVSHRPIKRQSRLWSQRGTKVNGSHHGDNPLLRPTGIQIATKSYAALQAMAPTNIKTVHQTSLLHSRATSIDSECCRLPTTSVLSKKPEKLRSNQF